MATERLGLHGGSWALPFDSVCTETVNTLTGRPSTFLRTHLFVWAVSSTQGRLRSRDSSHHGPGNPRHVQDFLQDLRRRRSGRPVLGNRDPQ